MSTVRMAWTSGPLAGMPGADGPELKNFDPLKLAESSPEWVPWFREAELKHGRIAMLAAAGYAAVDLGVTLPDHAGIGSFAAHNSAVASGAMVQILIWTSILEHVTLNAVTKGLKDGTHTPGNYMFNPLNFGKSAKEMEKLQVNELKNGRLAMMAISGMVTADALTGGHGFPYTGN